MIDDGRVQRAVFQIGVADVHRGENVSTCPWLVSFHHQHRAGAITQQLPVLGSEQGALEGVVRHVLLDHQPATFGLLHVDDGLMDALVPRLLGGHLMALASQLFAQCGQVGTVVVFGIAHQQVQA